MKIEQIITKLEKDYAARKAKRGLTATPGRPYRYYEQAVGLDFVLCCCSGTGAPPEGVEYIARTRTGDLWYVGIGTGKRISCGPEGCHFGRTGKACI